MRSFLNNQSIDCTAGMLSISSAAPVLCGGNVGCIPRKLFIWIGFRQLPSRDYFLSHRKTENQILHWFHEELACLSHHTRENFKKSFDIFFIIFLDIFSDLYHFSFSSFTNAPKFSYFYLFTFLWKTCVGSS